MLTRIRRALRHEEGVSLIEMMVALMMLSVGFLALLSTFTASARSILEQRAKAGATRVSSQELEELRASVWSSGALGTSAPVEKTVDGRPYTVTNTVSWADPSLTGGVSEALKEIETTVGWRVAGTGSCPAPPPGPAGCRYSTSRSAVQGTAVPPTDAQLTVDMLPTPVRAFRIVETPTMWRPSNASGVITVHVQVQRWDYAGQIELAWTNADGANKSVVINKSGTGWTTTLPANSNPDPAREIRATLDEAEEGYVDFTVRAVSAPTLQTTYRLALYGYNEFAPSFSMSPNPVVVNWHQQHGCQGTQRCRNQTSVWFYLWTPADSVPGNATAMMTWTQPNYQAIQLRREANYQGFAVWRAQVLTEGMNPHPHRPWERPNAQFAPGNITFTITISDSLGNILNQSTQVRAATL